MGEDLTPDKLPLPENCDNVCGHVYLERAHHYVVNEAQNIISWYMKKKKWYKRGSQMIRITSIVVFTIGGIIPLVAALEINLLPPGWSICKSNLIQFGYIILAFGGALILFDRCFGLTTGWVRFITAATKIQQFITEFEFDYLLLCREKRDRCHRAPQNVPLVGTSKCTTL